MKFVLFLVACLTVVVYQVRKAVSVALAAMVMKAAGQSRAAVMTFARCQCGALAINGLISFMVMAFIALLFIATFTPTLESSVSSDNVTNATTGAFLDMSVWIIPVAVIVGIILAGVGLFKASRSKKGG